jgi:hypothetical protein
MLQTNLSYPRRGVSDEGKAGQGKDASGASGTVGFAISRRCPWAVSVQRAPVRRRQREQLHDDDGRRCGGSSASICTAPREGLITSR